MTLSWDMRPIAVVMLALIFCAPAAKPQSADSTFHNPLLASGPDPWVVTANGFYYYMNTTGKNLTVWKTRASGRHCAMRSVSSGGAGSRSRANCSGDRSGLPWQAAQTS